MGEDRTGRDDSVDLDVGVRAYELLRAVLADRDEEQKESAARSVASSVLAEHGPDGLSDVAVDLALRLASALERIAADQGLTAIDLVDVWFDA